MKKTYGYRLERQLMQLLSYPEQVLQGGSHETQILFLEIIPSGQLILQRLLNKLRVLQLVQFFVVI
jgi:hypothetical protein